MVMIIPLRSLIQVNTFFAINSADSFNEVSKIGW